MANVTPQATAAQHDANLVGSAAWWANHKTADGQQ
jgi:hypothetical protein